MAGKFYLDKEKLFDVAVARLKEMKQKHSLCTMVDCTPTNIGRDLDLLRHVSQESGVNIISSTGFYYTNEIMTERHSEQYIEDLLLYDINNNSVGIIKYAVQASKMSDFDKKILDILCSVQKKTAIPLCIHTNSGCKNGTEVLQFVLDRNISPEAVTIGHCSDSEDPGYVKDLLSSGCYAGFDRIYRTDDTAYYEKKANDIIQLCNDGFSRKILLSHDNLCFNGFCDKAEIVGFNPYEVISERLLPCLYDKGLGKEEVNRLICDNPKNMLLAK
jgi:phosphotriesterase-related protein